MNSFTQLFFPELGKCGFNVVSPRGGSFLLPSVYEMGSIHTADDLILPKWTVVNNGLILRTSWRDGREQHQWALKRIALDDYGKVLWFKAYEYQFEMRPAGDFRRSMKAKLHSWEEIADIIIHPDKLDSLKWEEVD